MIKSGLHQHGFVLVVTLWILAIIAIAAAYFADRVTSSVTAARQSQLATDALVDMSSTRAEILFRMGASPLSAFGLGVTPQSAIALDNRAYRGIGQDVVYLQDSRGLLNLNISHPEMLLRLLGQAGVAAQNRDAMLDTLSDYIDTDDFRRLNGAESAQYKSLGLPLPTNDWLVTPWQLQNIIGWRDQAAIWKDRRFLEVVTTAPVIGFNPNTAPRDALAALPGSSHEIADNLIVRRALSPFVSLSQFVSVAGPVGLDSESMIFFPADNIRLTQESDKIPWVLRYQITLTPTADLAPWRIDYYIKTSLPSSAQNANKPSPTPLPARVAFSPPADPAL